MAVFDTYALNAFTALKKIFGEIATFTAQAGGQSKPITVIVSSTPPTIIAGDDMGLLQDRIIYVQVGVADVPTPARGDTYVLTRADHAGTWTANRPEKANAARWLIALRLSKHIQIAGAGAQQVRP